MSLNLADLQTSCCSVSKRQAPPPFDASALQAAITTSGYTTSNGSAELQVIDEAINFAVTFHLGKEPAVINSTTPLQLVIESRPAGLPLQLSVSSEPEGC